MGARIDSILQDCPPWMRVGMIGAFWFAIPLFGIMLAGRFYSGPPAVTAAVFALLLGVLTLLERVRRMALPADLAQVVEMYVEARTRFLGTGEGGKRFAWNAMRTLVASAALGIVLSFEPRLTPALWYMILVTGGIVIGFSSVRAFVWALLVISALAWMAAYLLIGVNFNSPASREVFLIGWTTGTVVLSWNWIIAAAFAGPLMIAMSVGGSQTLAQARYLQGLRREESEFDAMIEARRARLRRARSQQANQADEVDVDEPLRRAESELRAQVSKSPAQNSNEPVRFPQPEDFLKRDGGEMLALEHRDPMRILGEHAEFLQRIEAAEAASGRRHDTTGRRGFDRQLLNMSTELKSVMFGSTLAEIVALREYFESLVRLEQGVAANGIYAGVVPMPLGDLDSASPAPSGLVPELSIIDEVRAETSSAVGSDDEEIDVLGDLSSAKFDDLFGETKPNADLGGDEEGESAAAIEGDPAGAVEAGEGEDHPAITDRRLAAAQAAAAAEEIADASYAGDVGGLEEDAEDLGETSSGKEDEVNTSDGSGHTDRIEMLEKVRTLAEGRIGDIEDAQSDLEGAVPLGSTADVDRPESSESELSASGGEEVGAVARIDHAADQGKDENEEAGNADDGVPHEKGEEANVPMPSQAGAAAFTEDEALDDLAIMRRLMGGRVVTSLVLRGDRRFCEAEHMIALGGSALMARRVAARVAGWFEAYEVERDLLAALDLGEADPAFVGEMVGEMAGKGWIFSRKVGELAGLDGPFRDDAAGQVERAAAAAEAADVPVPEGSISEAVSDVDVEASKLPLGAELPQALAASADDVLRPAEEDVIVAAVSAADLDEALNGEPAADLAAADPEVAPLDLRGLGIRILAGSYDDELLDTAPDHFDSAESFAAVLGLPEASVATQYDQFLKVSRARAVHLAALSALEKGDVARVEELLERRAEFDGYDHPDVSLDALETWVKGQKAVGNVMGRAAGSTPSGMLDRLDGNRRMFVMKRCGLYQHKDILTLIDQDLPRSLSVLSGLLQVVAITGPEVDHSMSLVLERALRSTRELVQKIIEASAAAKISPHEYVDLIVAPLSPASNVGGWALLEALQQEPPAVDLGFDWLSISPAAGAAAAAVDVAASGGSTDAGPDAETTEGHDTEAADDRHGQMRRSALVIQVDARRTYEQVAALNPDVEIESLDVSKPVFPTVDEVQRSAKVSFRDLFAERVDAMIRVENSAKQMALKVEVQDNEGHSLGHVLCFYFPSNVPQPVWCGADSEKVHFLKVVDGKRETVARDLGAMRASIKSYLSSGVGDPDLCLAVAYMSPYLSQDGETSFQPVTDEFKGRFRILRSGGDSKLSMGALRDFVSGIRLLAANGGSENVFGKNASAQIPLLSVKE